MIYDDDLTDPFNSTVSSEVELTSRMETGSQ